MGAIQSPTPVLLLFAVTSRHEGALDWARLRIEATFGRSRWRARRSTFTETDYYAATMGVDLKKQFLAAGRLIEPGQLAAIKRQTNEWEAEYAALDRHPEPRPLNLDPGYITAAKLVLASTKDHAHRLYLQDGIYGEITLSYRHRAWQALEWTYPDYRRADFQEFFTRCRQFLLQHSGDK